MADGPRQENTKDQRHNPNYRNVDWSRVFPPSETWKSWKPVGCCWTFLLLLTLETRRGSSKASSWDCKNSRIKMRNRRLMSCLDGLAILKKYTGMEECTQYIYIREVDVQTPDQSYNIYTYISIHIHTYPYIYITYTYIIIHIHTQSCIYQCASFEFPFWGDGM